MEIFHKLQVRLGLLFLTQNVRAERCQCCDNFVKASLRDYKQIYPEPVHESEMGNGFSHSSPRARQTSNANK